MPIGELLARLVRGFALPGKTQPSLPRDKSRQAVTLQAAVQMCYCGDESMTEVGTPP